MLAKCRTNPLRTPEEVLWVNSFAGRCNLEASILYTMSRVTVLDDSKLIKHKIQVEQRFGSEYAQITQAK